MSRRLYNLASFPELFSYCNQNDVMQIVYTQSEVF